MIFIDALSCPGLQVVLPVGMTKGKIQSATGLQIFGGELMVAERSVEQVCGPACIISHAGCRLCNHALHNPCFLTQLRASTQSFDPEG